jgi:hypothetical protein
VQLSQSVEEVAELQSYLRGVLNRADHLADNVNEVVLALTGAIVWRKGPEPIRVYTQKGKTGNVLWAHIAGKKYAFSYDHVNGTIEMRSESIQGPVVRTFSNADTAASVKEFFANL